MIENKGCIAVLAFLFVAEIIGMFLVLPIWLLVSARDISGWGFPLLFLAVFTYIIAMFRGFEEHRIFNIGYWAFVSFAIMLSFRDICVRDVRDGLDLLLSIPLGLLIYFFVYEPFAKGMSETGKLITLKIVGLIGNVIVNLLILLILLFFLPNIAPHTP